MKIMLFKDKGFRMEVGRKAICLEGPYGSYSYLLKGKKHIPVVSNLKNPLTPKLFFFSHLLARAFLRTVEGRALGLVYGYYVELRLVGLGFKTIKFRDKATGGIKLWLELSYSHRIIYSVPESVYVKCEKRKITVFGSSAADVFNVAQTLKNFKRPNTYKGTGIRYEEEVIKLKPGKQR